MSAMIIALPGNEALTVTLARALGAETGALEYRSFPDGESYVRLASGVEGREVALVCTLDRPDDKFLRLCFAACVARDLGAVSVGLVAPYLAYMRQDKRFKSGEAVSSDYFARLMSDAFDWLVTIDPHLHRRHSLSELYTVPALAAQAAPALSEWIRANVREPLLIGPDSESAQWVQAVAEAAGAPFQVLEKERQGDREVRVSLPDASRLRGRTPVVLDDIISTAQSMVQTVRHLLAAGASAPVCVGVHGIFADNALRDLVAAGAGRVATTNTVAHETNAIDVSMILANAIGTAQAAAGAAHSPDPRPVSMQGGPDVQS